jgi:hypothetical protein
MLWQDATLDKTIRKKIRKKIFESIAMTDIAYYANMAGNTCMHIATECEKEIYRTSKTYDEYIDTSNITERIARVLCNREDLLPLSLIITGDEDAITF